MKVIFDANPIVRSNKSGVGYFTSSLISTLSRSGTKDIQLIGHYFNFLDKKSVEGLPEATNISFKHSRLFPTKVLNIGRRLGIQLPFELFSREKADITLFTNFTALPTVLGGKRVSIIYDVSYLDCPEYAPERLVSYLKKWVPYTVRTSDLIIVNSEFTKQRLIDEYKVSKSTVLVIPIPPMKHTQPDDKILGKMDLRNKEYVLFVGTIEPRKNIRTLIDAYSKLGRSFGDKYPLVLAGGKGWKDTDILYEIKSLQEKGFNIKQTGYVTDAEKSALYEHATLCVQPSLYEGFGMPILEAMSYEKPVACSDIAVFREVAGDSASYFDPKDTDSIAKSINGILNDKTFQNNLIKRSKERIKSYPTWDKVGKELYEKLVEL
jgi:glycosyltransferase involved in cell wall biosynthesis